MVYFIVKKEADQIKTGKGWFFIGGELITEKELIKKHGITNPLVNMNLEQIDISRKKTYFLFGARFEIK